jgi:hypothetical protein
MAQVTTSLEETVLEVLRQLPAERQKQVLDFARFMEHQVSIPEDADEVDGDARWEELFASEKSQLALEKMAEQARADIKAGRMTNIDIVDGELKPR